MEDARDFRLPDSFRSKKRSFLLFSSALLLLGLSEATSPTVNAVMLDIGIDRFLLWWALAFGSGYYGYGFYDDARFTLTLNAEGARNKEGLEAVFDDLRAKLSRISAQTELNKEQFIKKLNDFFDHAPKEQRDWVGMYCWQMDDSFFRNAVLMLPVPDEFSDEFRRWLPTVSNNLAEQIAETIPSQKENFSAAMDKWRSEFSAASGHLEFLSSTIPSLSDSLGSLRKTYSTLAGSIDTRRKQGLLFWEIGAPFALFALAVIAGAPLGTQGLYNLFAYGPQILGQYLDQLTTYPWR